MKQTSSAWWLTTALSCAGCDHVAWGNLLVALVAFGLLWGTLSMGRTSREEDQGA